MEITCEKKLYEQQGEESEYAVLGHWTGIGLSGVMEREVIEDVEGHVTGRIESWEIVEVGFEEIELCRV